MRAAASPVALGCCEHMTTDSARTATWRRVRIPSTVTAAVYR
jgi:hypothetical protein